MGQHKPTFSQILNGLKKSNSEKLMLLARLANRIAKKSHGHKKQLAYSVKHKALCTLVHQLPAQIEIRKDIVLTDFVIVELKIHNPGCIS